MQRQQYVESLDEQNQGPARAVRIAIPKRGSFGSGVAHDVTLECGHRFEDVNVPVKFKLKKVYNCGQCRANSNNAV